MGIDVSIAISLIGIIVAFFAVTIPVSWHLSRKWRELEGKAREIRDEKMRIVDAELVNASSSCIISFLPQIMKIGKKAGLRIESEVKEGIEKVGEMIMATIKDPNSIKELKKGASLKEMPFKIDLEEDRDKLFGISSIGNDLKNLPEKISRQTDKVFHSFYLGIVALILAFCALFTYLLEVNILPIIIASAFVTTYFHVGGFLFQIKPLRKVEKQFDRLKECKNIDELREIVHEAIKIE